MSNPNTTTTSDATLVAELNDLLRLDQDAVQAYGIAIGALRNESYRQSLASFRADHERHIDELDILIRSHGGAAINLPHLSSGPFKLALQALSAVGGERAILLAFKANERQVRDRYRASARDLHTADVTSVLARAAEDERRHYLWVLETLEDDFGVSAESTVGRAERAVEVAHARLGTALDGVEQSIFQAAESGGRMLVEQARKNPLGSALAALGAGFVAARVLGGRR
jgi:rubrerythrin